jgi:aminoglycoside/choline kinase family phosphotransferase
MELPGNKTTIKKDLRLERAQQWLLQLGVDQQSGFEDIAGDASFRRYFRLRVDGLSRVLMDSPPPGNNLKPFMDVARRLRNAGLHAPQIIRANAADGFLLLEDLGDDLFRDLLDENNVDTLFAGLFDILKSMAQTVDTTELPAP